MLGIREPEIYGNSSLEDIKNKTSQLLKNHRLECELIWYQSNVEGEIVNRIQSSIDEGFDGIIINPAAYTHTSVAILDALKMIKITVAEVHLTNTSIREEFRRQKITTMAAEIVLEGLGIYCYFHAIFALIMRLKDR